MRILIGSFFILVLAAGAAAQVDPDPDSVGIYFDTGATVWCADCEAERVVTFYLCLTRPSSPNGIGGFEVTVDPGDLLFLAANITEPHLNMLSPPEFMVGFGNPLPGSDVVVLAELTCFVLDEKRVEFFLRPNDISSIPPMACYTDGADPRLLIPMTPSSGSWDRPVAVLNGECDVVPTEATTWGGLKTMYTTDEGEVVR